MRWPAALGRLRRRRPQLDARCPPRSWLAATANRRHPVFAHNAGKAAGGSVTTVPPFQLIVATLLPPAGARRGDFRLRSAQPDPLRRKGRHENRSSRSLLLESSGREDYQPSPSRAARSPISILGARSKPCQHEPYQSGLLTVLSGHLLKCRTLQTYPSAQRRRAY
jgi:hypothetical protein